MFWYDRLLMPARFWAPRRRHSSNGTADQRNSDVPEPVADERLRLVPAVLARPPSGSAWVLYQNMQRVWRFTFTPATGAAAVGVVSIVLPESEPSGLGWLGFAGAIIAVTLIATIVARASAPDLGVQD